MTYSVLVRFHGGRNIRNVPVEKRKEVSAAFRDLYAKWKSAGIKLKASFNCSSHPAGFAHHLIFEVDSFEQMKEMDGDIMREKAGSFLENYDLHIGGSFAEDWWAEV